MGGGHEIFRTHSLGVAETQSLPEAHGAGRLADPLNPAPGRLNGRAELRSPRYSRSGQLARFRQWILLRPRQQMQRGIVGKLLTRELALRGYVDAGTCPENRDSIKGNAFDRELCCSLATLQRNGKRATSFALNFAFLPLESRFSAALTAE